MIDVLLHAPQIGACGLNCKHCWVTHNLKQHKPLGEVKKMIDSLAETLEEPAITKRVLLYFLDELTLHPQVIEILAYCRERNVLPQPTLVSNGHGIAIRDNWKEILAGLKKCGLKGFLMTINGDEKYHDWFTGSKGSYQKTLEATRRANSYGFFVVWNMYLTNENVDQVVEAARLKGDNKISISIPIHTTRWRQLPHIHADIEVFSRIPEDCKEFVRQDFKSEAEWVDLILKGEVDSPTLEAVENESKLKIKGYFECENILYDEVACPEFNVGSLSTESLKEIYASEVIPPGIKADKSMDIYAMAKKYGDPKSTTAFSLNGLRRKWAFDDSE